MTCTINASTSSSAIVSTADGSGVLKVQSNGVTTNALAWVKFAGATGTISASYNITSVTRTGTGNYTIAFTSAASDANYVFVASGVYSGSGPSWMSASNAVTQTINQFAVTFTNMGAGGATYTPVDPASVFVTVFGN